jgi:hypothetical protein
MVDEKNEDVNESFGNDDDIDEVDQKATAGGKAEAKANGATAPEDDSAEDVSEKALAIPLNTLSKAQLKVFMESHWLVTIGNKVAVAY